MVICSLGGCWLVHTETAGAVDGGCLIVSTVKCACNMVFADTGSILALLLVWVVYFGFFIFGVCFVLRAACGVCAYALAKSSELNIPTTPSIKTAAWDMHPGPVFFLSSKRAPGGA